MVYCGKMTKNEGEGRWFTVGKIIKNEGEGRWFTVGNEREDNGIDYTVALLIILILLLPFSSVVIVAQLHWSEVKSHTKPSFPVHISSWSFLYCPLLPLNSNTGLYTHAVLLINCSNTGMEILHSGLMSHGLMYIHFP